MAGKVMGRDGFGGGGSSGGIDDQKQFGNRQAGERFFVFKLFVYGRETGFGGLSRQARCHGERGESLSAPGAAALATDGADVLLAEALV